MFDDIVTCMRLFAMNFLSSKMRCFCRSLPGWKADDPRLTVRLSSGMSRSLADCPGCCGSCAVLLQWGRGSQPVPLAILHSSTKSCRGRVWHLVLLWRLLKLLDFNQRSLKSSGEPWGTLGNGSFQVRDLGGQNDGPAAGAAGGQGRWRSLHSRSAAWIGSGME